MSSPICGVWAGLAKGSWYGFWRGANPRRILADELFPVPRVAKSFRAARACHRKRTCDIAKFQAVLQFRPADVLVDEPRIEAVARSDRVNRVNHRWKSTMPFFSHAHHRAL